MSLFERDIYQPANPTLGVPRQCLLSGIFVMTVVYMSEANVVSPGRLPGHAVALTGQWTLPCTLAAFALNA